MPSVLSGQSAGTRQIVIDLNDASASSILTSPSGTRTQIGHIHLSGVTGAGDGTIVIRTDSASGPIVWKFEANVGTATRFIDSVTFNYHCAPIFRNGIYFDALNTAWAAGATLILYTI